MNRISSPRDIRVDSPAALKRELERLWDALNSVPVSPQLKLYGREQNELTGTVLEFGKVSMINLASASRVTCPRAELGETRLFGIAKRGSGVLSIDAQPGTTINDAASISMVSARLLLGWFDGRNYWTTT